MSEQNSAYWTLTSKTKGNCVKTVSLIFILRSFTLFCSKDSHSEIVSFDMKHVLRISLRNGWPGKKSSQLNRPQFFIKWKNKMQKLYKPHGWQMCKMTSKRHWNEFSVKEFTISFRFCAIIIYIVIVAFVVCSEIR